MADEVPKKIEPEAQTPPPPAVDAVAEETPVPAPEAPKAEGVKAEGQPAPVTPATIRKDLAEELELLGDRAMGKLKAYARQSLAVIGSFLDGFEDDQKPPAKDVPTKTKG